MSGYGAFTSTTTSSTPSTNTTTTNQLDVSFSKIMDEINGAWKQLNEKQKQIMNDIQHLERMFHAYENHTLFYQTKEILVQEKTKNRQKINQLEEQIFLVKRNCSAFE